jgi:septum formation protein
VWKMARLILASASPRRRRLLEQIGLSFSVAAAMIPETFPTGCAPAVGAMRAADEKSKEVARRVPKGLVLGADTIVVCDEMILGKPRGKEDATRMLTSLQGREHRVITGVALRDTVTGKCLLEHEITTVRMRALTAAEIKGYIATGEPFDKAGAYGIQGKGALLVEGIIGCYFNVVGLPLARLAQMLAYFHFDLWNDGGRN